MQGSLVLDRGVLWVGRHEKTAHVRAFDQDGRELGPGFSFRDETAGRSEAAGLAIDGDGHLWVADRAAGLVRGFTVFGREFATLGPGPGGTDVDRPGVAAAPVAVAAHGDAETLSLLVGSAGVRRNAVQRFDVALGRVYTLRSEGDPRGRFRGVRGLAWRDERTFVAEAGAARVQVFRRGEFLFAFRVAGRPGARFEPTAVAPLADGRAVVACGGAASALVLVDAGGRVLRTLAGYGTGEGAVFEPGDVAVAEGADDAHARVFAVDRDGDRVQVWNLEGRCYGAFAEVS